MSPVLPARPTSPTVPFNLPRAARTLYFAGSFVWPVHSKSEMFTFWRGHWSAWSPPKRDYRTVPSSKPSSYTKGGCSTTYFRYTGRSREGTCTQTTQQIVFGDSSRLPLLPHTAETGPVHKTRFYKCGMLGSFPSFGSKRCCVVFIFSFSICSAPFLGWFKGKSKRKPLGVSSMRHSLLMRRP